jgi:hypothetical protein
VIPTMPSQDIEIKNTLRYEGYGSAEFGMPAIRVEGPTVVNTDERGNTVSTMQVERVPSAASMDAGITLLFRDFFNNMNKRTPCSLQVKCSDGVFSATEQTFRDPSVDVPNQKATIEFRCFRSVFDTGRAAAHWRLPIWNFNGDLRPAMSMRNVEHPLRLSQDNPISAFEFLGEIAFVEMVPGYKELLEHQENGDRNPRVTAAMVGSAKTQSTTWEGLESWFPFDFLNLLGFASGSRVGAPWIEFLDVEGRIVKRIHTHLGTNRYETGRAFIHEPINRGGLGRLLTCAGMSPEFDKTYIRVAMNHLLLGVRYSQALEDKISHLSRGLDALAGEFGLGTQYLLDRADDSVKSQVKDVLGSASSQIADMAREQDARGFVDMASSLRRIAERTISTPANVDRDFGLTVVSLLERLGLDDAAVVDAYHKSNPRADGRKWHQVLSHYRGLSQHGGAFRVRTKEHSPLEIYKLSNHLADIIARIILKQLGYDGEYQRATLTWRDSSELDWVRPSTPAVQLGYGSDD